MRHLAVRAATQRYQRTVQEPRPPLWLKPRTMMCSRTRVYSASLYDMQYGGTWLSFAKDLAVYPPGSRVVRCRHQWMGHDGHYTFREDRKRR